MSVTDHFPTCRECGYWSPSELDGAIDEYTHHLAPDEDLDAHHGICMFAESGADGAWVSAGGHLVTDGRFYSCPYFAQKT
jgi:hypothetical protein